MKNFDVAIVGAGICGCAIARELSKYDLNIALIEKGHDVSLGATKANSGMIHGGYNAHAGSIKQTLNIRGNQLYRSLDQELNFGIDWIGSYVIGFTQEDEQTLLSLQDNGQKGGLHTQIYSREETLERNPNLNPKLKRSLFCKHSGIIAPYEACIAFAENAVKNGVELFLNNEVKSIEKREGGFIINTPQTEIKAKVVINAAGLYSDVIAAMLDADNFRIIPRRGSYLLFNKGANKLVSGFIFSCPSSTGKGVTVSPTYHGNLFVGPDAMKAASKEDTGTELEALVKIIEDAQHLIPSLPLEKLIRNYSGIRASSTAKDFIVEESRIAGFINVAGIESPGLSSAPAIAEHVVTLIKDMPEMTLVERSDFDPYRSSLTERKTLENMRPYAEIQPLLKLPDSDDEQIVCRCEQVSRATIINTLKESPMPLTHLEGVKRRIRTGMGACQGSYCESRVKKIVAEFYNMNEADVKGYDWEQHKIKRVSTKEVRDYFRSQKIV